MKTLAEIYEEQIAQAALSAERAIADTGRAQWSKDEVVLQHDTLVRNAIVPPEDNMDLAQAMYVSQFLPSAKIVPKGGEFGPHLTWKLEMWMNNPRFGRTVYRSIEKMVNEKQAKKLLAEMKREMKEGVSRTASLMRAENEE